MAEKQINTESIKKILIIKLRGIGDVVLSTVVFDNLLNDFPDAEIDFLTEKPSSQILETLPFLNKILIFNRKSTYERLKLMREVRRRKYDLILDFFSNPSTAQITFFSGAKFRAGFPYRGRKYAYNLYGPSDRTSFHAAQLHLEFLKQIGLSYHSANLKIGLHESDLEFARDYYTSQNLIPEQTIIISPSGGWPSKKCDPEKFAEIAKAIQNSFNFKILIVWGPGDLQEAEKIHTLLHGTSVLSPQTTIRQMAALMKLARAVIANDSGPMHIATAVKTPTLALHGPTNPRLQGPFGKMHEWVRLDSLDCIECNLLECPRNHECFRDLPVESVMAKFQTLLKKTPSDFQGKN